MTLVLCKSSLTPMRGDGVIEGHGELGLGELGSVIFEGGEVGSKPRTTRSIS